MPFNNYNIYRLNTTSLRHNQLIGLVTDSVRVTKNFLSLDDEDTVLRGRVEQLEGLLEQYNQTQNMVRKSIVTADLDIADKKRDKAFLLITSLVRNYSRSQTSELQLACKSLQALLATYQTVISQSYEAETVALNRLLKQLETSPYKEAVQTLALSPFVEELRQAQAEFDILYQQRLLEQTNKAPAGQVGYLRQEVLNGYYFIVDYTAIMAEAYPEKLFYHELLAQFNTIRQVNKAPRKTTAIKLPSKEEAEA